MKKYLLTAALSVAALGAIVSCDSRDNDPVVTEQVPQAQMRDITGNFTSPNYTINQAISIPSTDVVLVYRNENSNTGNGAVWQLLPKTYYLSGDRELDYGSLFNTQQAQVYAEGNFDLSTMTAAEKNQYLNNQNFRIVLIPASTGKNAKVDYNDYNSVAEFYGLPKTKK